MEIKITLPDGTIRSVAEGTTGLQLARSLHNRLGKEALAMTVNGKPWDLSRPLGSDVSVKIFTWESPEGKNVFWHSTAHLLAEAIEACYPRAQLGIGPPIEGGFYYDVDFQGEAFSSEHLLVLEGKMKELLKGKRVFKRLVVSKAEAIAHFTKHYNPYKLELLEGLKDGEITFYQQGDFVDLCKGTHLPNTSYIKAFKLMSVAGAYWRGDVKRKQLTRIYGVSFPKKSLLEQYITRREEALKRDHRKLGKELGFFTFSEKVGSGLPLWLPKGAFVRGQLMTFLREAQVKAGYLPVVTPHIGHKNLYITSGHYQKYKEDTFRSICTPQPGEEFFLKPMNCPHHCIIYQTTPKSYRELPIRYAEFGTVYRYEQSGELHGLTRTRGFTQDDAHIFCRPDQVKDEFTKVIDLVLYIFKKFDFHDYQVQISLRDPEHKAKYIGGDEAWHVAEKAIQEAVESKGLQAKTVLGEAAFYGPKLDFMVKDVLGRQWQLGTVQMDYQLPERFDLTYIGSDNRKHRPVMIHRAPFGSLERFMAILLEHTGGKLPLWLCFEQVAVLPLSALHNAYAEQVVATLKSHKIRTKLDLRDEKIGRKIRDAEQERIPYMLLVGKREEEAKRVAVRKQGEGEQGTFSLDDFIEVLKSGL